MEFLIIGHNTIIIGHPCFVIYDHNVPCAVCYTSKRVSKLIIPARITCPSSWTEEYEEYLKAERHTILVNGALFYHVIATCGTGLPCPPYVTTKTITCVVCTK